MEPEVQKALLQMLQDAKGLAAQEIPLVLKDLLTAGMVSNSIGVLVALALACGTYLLYRAYRYWQTHDEESGSFCDDYEMQRFFGGIGILAGSVGSLVVMALSIYNIIIIQIAPRAYLLEMALGSSK